MYKKITFSAKFAASWIAAGIGVPTFTNFEGLNRGAVTASTFFENSSRSGLVVFSLKMILVIKAIVVISLSC